MASEPTTSPSSTDLDLELVRRMQAGDERALGAFYDRWFPVVHSVVARIVIAGDDAEDVVEETFWQVWRQASRFAADRGSVQTWVLTIARSRSLDRLRAMRRLREESMDALGPGERAEDALLVSPAADPSLSAEHGEQRRLVLAALAELPPEQRETLELGYYGGLSQSEIAERTGQPLGTVKTRMRLAMMKLRERLSVLREVAP
ncbi:MAG TPA: sigma-70 family RNA polymerase sigma factor [Gemmatimonadaceae bacterium]|nr:sigma-70 family RNA polymerase sigma factor [Gemmatimonadaceae bacterium]